MAEFYKLDIADWNEGTAMLTLEQEAAYLRIVNAIRLNGQAISFNQFALCGMWRCNERKAKRLLQELIDAGKITIEDGRIVNRRAVDEASTLSRLRADRQSAGRRGGIESGKARAKPLENNETGETSASTREEKRREEENRESGVELARARDHAPADTPAHMRGPDDPPAPMIFSPEQDALFDRVLKAVGQDRGAITTYWMPPQAIVEVIRFRGFGLTDDEIVAVAHEVRRSRNEPIRGPRGLETQMKLMAAAKQQPPFIPPGAQDAQPRRRLTAVARDASDIAAIERAARS